MTRRFDARVEERLRAAGWEPGRTVEEAIVAAWETALLDTERPLPPAVQSILAEFGGLSVRQAGSGWRRTLDFDPTLASGEADERTLPAGRLYPLGESDGGHGLLFAAEDGAVWTYSVDQVLRMIGHDIDDALDRHLLQKPPAE
jgi:hypothetical protein